MAEAQAPAAEGSEQFAIQRLYVKDLSLESPNSPQVFTSEWKPEVNLDINTASNELGEDTHEVVLTLTVTVKSGDTTAFLVEVKQGGIFTIKGFPADALEHTIGSFCPSVLYPYAREVVSDVVMRGGFPQLILAPVNFEALFAQHAAEGEGANGKAANA